MSSGRSKSMNLGNPVKATGSTSQRAVQPVAKRPMASAMAQQQSRPPTSGYQMDSVADGGALGCGGICCVMLSWMLVILTFPFALSFCLKIVQEYERIIIFRLGRVERGGARPPGMYLILPFVEWYRMVDLRTYTYDVPPQEVLSKDSVTVQVDAVVYFRVSDATLCVIAVENAVHSTQLLAQTTLRNMLGTKTLAEMLSDRESIAHAMQSSLDIATDPWGVTVERVEIKNLRLPEQLQRAMAAEAEASREARAKVLAAEGEEKASRALRDAAVIISESPGALQLRYLQTLNTIASERNSTIVFPLPMDLMTAFMRRQNRP